MIATCHSPALSFPAHAQTVHLTLRRVCALPTCSINGGGMHHLPLCEEKSCPETERMGGSHSALLSCCSGGAMRQKQVPLYKVSSAHNPAFWWSCPEVSALLDRITLPAHLAGYTNWSGSRSMCAPPPPPTL